MGVLPYKFQRLFKKLSLNNDGHRHRYDKLENGDHQKPSRSPKGFIPIYVGEERKRYIVPTAAANSAAFKAMLDKYQDDITPFGPLEVPCSVAAFDHVLRCALDQTRNSKR
ncbi:auxin-induced protein 15A-like [Sesamum indicum]|uniref:Auxin-induced protein 15A-like n=1 Tax=Sesamum indicum TaxID=4182 RepID=A0A6I9UA30_SESIN|nr:auxin-induced protein 15A-like [Sesamum indicum]